MRRLGVVGREGYGGIGRLPAPRVKGDLPSPPAECVGEDVMAGPNTVGPPVDAVSAASAMASGDPLDLALAASPADRALLADRALFADRALLTDRAVGDCGGRLGNARGVGLRGGARGDNGFHRGDAGPPPTPPTPPDRLDMMEDGEDERNSVAAVSKSTAVGEGDLDFLEPGDAARGEYRGLNTLWLYGDRYGALVSSGFSGGRVGDCERLNASSLWSLSLKEARGEVDRLNRSSSTPFRSFSAMRRPTSLRATRSFRRSSDGSLCERARAGLCKV